VGRGLRCGGAVSGFGVTGFGVSAFSCGDVASAAATSTAGSVTPQTTFWAIRSQMAATIAALSLRYHEGYPLRLTLAEHNDFRAWADDNDAAAFREYEIVELETRVIGSQDLDVQMRETDCEVVVAYPEHWGKYAGITDDYRQNRAAMMATIESDTNAIVRAIGVRGSANYLDGQHAAIESGFTTERGTGVTFAVISMTVTYYHDAG